MDKRLPRRHRLPKKYQSGCACAFGSLNASEILHGCQSGKSLLVDRHGLVAKHGLVRKNTMPPPELPSGSVNRITSAADETDIRISRREGYSGRHCKDSELKSHRRLLEDPNHRSRKKASKSKSAAVAQISCSNEHPKSRGGRGHGRGLGLGCRSIREVTDENITKINLRKSVQKKQSTEAVVNQKLINGEKSKQFLEALYLLNSNKQLFMKLLGDPNSFLAKHIQELRQSQEDNLKSNPVSNVERLQKGGKNEGDRTLSPRKLRIWDKFLPKRSANEDISCEIVILKPGSEDGNGRENHGLHFGSDNGVRNGIRAVGQSHFPSRNLRKKWKHRTGRILEHPEEVEKDVNDNTGLKANRSGEETSKVIKLTTMPSYKYKELNSYCDVRSSFVRKQSREDQIKVFSNESFTGVVKRSFSFPEYNFLSFLMPERFGEQDSIPVDTRSVRTRCHQMYDQHKLITDEEKHCSLVSADKGDYTSNEPDHRPPHYREKRATLCGTDPCSVDSVEEERRDIARMVNVMQSEQDHTSDKQSSEMNSRTCHRPNYGTRKTNELEGIEVTECLPKDVPWNQTRSSSSDDPFRNYLEKPENSADDRVKEDQESPVYVLEHRVIQDITTATDKPLESYCEEPKPEFVRPLPELEISDIPPDKFGLATELMNSIFMSSDLNWDMILTKNHWQDHLLPPSIVCNTRSYPHQPGDIDTRLLYDYTTEVLQEVIDYQWHLMQRGESIGVINSVASEVMKVVDRDFMLPQVQQSNTLDRIVMRDLAKHRTPWMHLGKEADEIIAEIVGSIVEYVMDDIL